MKRKWPWNGFSTPITTKECLTNTIGMPELQFRQYKRCLTALVLNSSQFKLNVHYKSSTQITISNAIKLPLNCYHFSILVESSLIHESYLYEKKMCLALILRQYITVRRYTKLHKPQLRGNIIGILIYDLYGMFVVSLRTVLNGK